MKDFINDCLLFKSKDKEIRTAGIICWIGLIGMTILVINAIFENGYKIHQ